jgi:putative phosphoribosyl transferase
VFEDRLDAGRSLVSELSRFADSPGSILLALPRGGVAIGFALHQALRLPLDVFITRKLRAPENPEFAIGALTETGYRFVNPDVRDLFLDSWGEAYLKKETEHQRLEIERRKQLYRNGDSLPELAGRTVFLVDDGVATGSTVVAAVRGVRALEPRTIIVAVPVGSPQAATTLRGEADQVVVLSTPPRFRAVGEYYEHFEQVSDDDVIAYLKAARTPGTTEPSLRIE